MSDWNPSGLPADDAHANVSCETIEYLTIPPGHPPIDGYLEYCETLKEMGYNENTDEEEDDKKDDKEDDNPVTNSDDNDDEIVEVIPTSSSNNPRLNELDKVLIYDVYYPGLGQYELGVYRLPNQNTAIGPRDRGRYDMVYTRNMLSLYKNTLKQPYNPTGVVGVVDKEELAILLFKNKKGHLTGQEFLKVGEKYYLKSGDRQKLSDQSIGEYELEEKVDYNADGTIGEIAAINEKSPKQIRSYVEKIIYKGRPYSSGKSIYYLSDRNYVVSDDTSVSVGSTPESIILIQDVEGNKYKNMDNVVGVFSTTKRGFSIITRNENGTFHNQNFRWQGDEGPASPKGRLKPLSKSRVKALEKEKDIDFSGDGRIGRIGKPTLPENSIVSDDELDPLNTINGTKKKDRLLGSNSDDLINGYAGQDKIKGKAGDDIINPGNHTKGKPDTVWGGSGKDTFIITDKSRAVIKDFNIIEDILDLPDSSWAWAPHDFKNLTFIYNLGTESTDEDPIVELRGNYDLTVANII